MTPSQDISLERLSELLGRVEGAEGPDREIDAGIAATALGMNVWDEPVMDFHTGLSRLKTSVMSDRSKPTDEHRFFDVIPAYTASLDAALVLVERVLPGWTVALLSQQDDKSWFAELREGYLTSYNRVATSEVRIKPKTPALALLAALLRALLAQAEGAQK